jgi:hypothetical protein
VAAFSAHHGSYRLKLAERQCEIVSGSHNLPFCNACMYGWRNADRKAQRADS